MQLKEYVRKAFVLCMALYTVPRSTSCQGEEIPSDTMWAAINLASDRQAMFSEDRVGANALCRGKKKKDKDAEAVICNIFFNLHVL